MDSELQITADEINCLIYAYLQDSGFEHSSYALRTEARLDLSPNAKIPIPRGELVDLLSKALLYTEVEAHWKLDANTTKCTESFSLLTPHTCHVHQTRRHDSRGPVLTSPRHELFPLPQTNGNNHEPNSTAQKRKSSPELSDENRAEKRICVGGDIEMRQIEEAEGFHPISERSITTNNSTDHDGMVQDMQEFSAPTEVPVIKTEEHMSPVVLLQGHNAEVFNAAWNPVFPGLLATGSKDTTVRVWSWDDINRANIGNYLSPDMSFPMPPSGSQYLRPNAVILRHDQNSDQADITSLDWNAEGTLVATGSYDRLLRIWQKNGEPYMTKIHHSGPIFSVQFSKSGKWLLSASLDGTAAVWDVASQTVQMQFRVNTSCLDIDWLDDSTFAICSADHAIHLVSLWSSRAIRTFTGHTNEVNQVKFNKHRTILASCSDDTTARVWFDDSWKNPDGSMATPDHGLTDEELAALFPPKFILMGHTHPVGAIEWCPTQADGIDTLLATCSLDKTARLWDTLEGTCLRVFTENTKPLFSIAFSSEGRFIATGSEDGYICIYKTATGDRIWRWPANGPGVGPIYEVNWQKLGNGRLAMCMKSKTVGIVDTARIPELIHHYDPV